MQTIIELRKKDSKGLHAELKQTRLEYAKVKMPIKMRQDKKTHVGQEYKKLIAQILTLINQKHAQ